jgi:hypothetical protein
VVFPITDSIREILFPLQGQHPEFVFTYVAAYDNKRLGRVRGQRYPANHDRGEIGMAATAGQGGHQRLPVS